ncbi:SDR family NAD(P)-dependent oxidoreductase [Streptomyces sp. NPDC096132]|uniref:SDR family NAD(P)-dependent oxidoreductase n=1 Tax=Streptomyces sp. NPDC096132 TaxID=3366075 RepID=UPI0037FC8BFF
MSSANEAATRPLDEKTAIVVGAAGGIGRNIAALLAERGATVVFADRDEAGARAAAAESGGRATGAGLDATDSAQCDALVAKTAAEHGGLDLLVYAAGIMTARPAGPDGEVFVPLLDQDDDGWRHVLDVNLTGGFYTLRAGARAMVEAGRGGSIVALTSGGAVRPLVGRGPYCVSKAGLAMLVKSLADEVASAGVRVNAVAPGITETPMTAELLNDPVRSAALPLPPLGRHGKPDDIASAVAFLLGPESAFISGKTLYVDGGVFNG